MLFNDADQETTVCRNPECNEDRYKENGKPVRKMKMFSIGDQVASMPANSKVRDSMNYRSKFVPVTGQYTDYFSGEAYKGLVQQGCFAGENDVALALFVDGFTATQSTRAAHLNIVHMINLNLPPEIRYEDMYTRQVAILSGPNNPKSLLDTFLLPIVEELQDLSTKGMIVRVNS